MYDRYFAKHTLYMIEKQIVPVKSAILISSSIEAIYTRQCSTRAIKIIKDPTHPSNCLFSLLKSGRRFCSLVSRTERLRRSFFPQAIILLNTAIPTTLELRCNHTVWLLMLQLIIDKFLIHFAQSVECPEKTFHYKL